MLKKNGNNLVMSMAFYQNDSLYSSRHTFEGIPL